MYKTFTLFTLSLLMGLGLHAQNCIPEAINVDTAIILPVPYNFDNMTGGLDSTCVGLFYEQVLTTLVPQTIPFAGQEFSIDSISIDLEGAIDGLPEGLDYACNPPSCVFAPDSLACFVITGTTDAMAEAKTYDLVLRIKAYNFLFPTGATITYPDDLGNDNESYFIHVSAADSCDVTVSTSQLAETLQSSIAPNPARDVFDVNINADHAQDVQILILDVLGKVYEQIDYSITPGANTIPFDVHQLSQGIYFLSITNGQDFVTHKLVIED